MSIGSLGAGSGLDLESLVKQMVSAQKDSKIQLYETRIRGYESELSALGRVSSAIDNFKSSVKSLNNDDLFTGRDAKIAQKEGEEVIAITTDRTASNGSYSIDVNQLAKGSRVMSAPGLFSSPDNVIADEEAKLTFTAGSNEFSINVKAGTTLSELRNQVNTAEDNFGVSVNLVDDGAGNLFFTATSEIQGAENSLRISNNAITRDEAGNVIEDVLPPEEEPAPQEKPDKTPVVKTDPLDLEGDEFDFANDGPIPKSKEKDPLDATESVDVKAAALEAEKAAESKKTSDLDADKVKNTSFSLNSVSTEGASAGLYVPFGEQARDAIITVDGIQIRSETNSFDDAVAGLSIEALSETERSTKVDVSFDQKTVKDTIQEFISSYNDMVGLLKASTNRGAVLNGNSMIRNLQSSLSTELMSSRGETGTFTSIFDLGVKMSSQGVLSLDNAKFDEAMRRGYSEIAPLISGDKGLAKSLENLLDNYTGPRGMTNSLKDSVRRSIDNTEGTLEAYEDRMVKYEESLRSKFTSLDSRLAVMNAQGGYLNSVLANM